MTDFTRPNAQWADNPSSASALTPWHFLYSESGGVGTLTLASGLRRRLGPGLVVTADTGTVLTLGISQQVNGEVEAQVAALQDVVYVTV